MIKNIKWLLLASITIVACSKNEDTTVVNNTSDGLPLTAGSANFSKYVSLGNSLCAGYSDGALFAGGQKNSYPAILASQFALAGGGEFKIPYMADNVGGMLFGGTANPSFGPRLYYTGSSTAPAAPVAGPPTTDVTTHLTGPFNNMGVPGAKSYHLIAPGYGNIAGLPATANPYFVRFATSPTTTVLADAMAQTPTFFSLWIGNNDVLGYATAGGDSTIDVITPQATFDYAYNTLATTLTSGGAKGVVANIPYVTSIPFFTTVPYNPLSPSALGGAPTISYINSNLYGPLKAILNTVGEGGRINLLSSTAANPLLIKDETLSDQAPLITAALTTSYGAVTAAAFGAIFGKARQTTSADLVLLTTGGVIGTTVAGAPSAVNKYGVTYPLQDKHILIPTEIAELKTATDAFNVTIKAAATSKSLAFVDANAIMSQIAATGYSYNGFTMTNAYVTGNSFSLDGVHPSPRGYALIANKFLEAINMTYGSNFKGVDLGNYRILYPYDSSSF